MSDYVSLEAVASLYDGALEESIDRHAIHRAVQQKIVEFEN